MKVIAANSKWLEESNLRLDGKFHLSDGRLARKEIEKSPYQVKSIKDITENIFYGGRDKRIYVDSPEKGVPFMGSADMLKSDFNTLKHISRKHTKNIKSYLLESYWTLISRSGTIGNTVYTNSDYQNKAASEHIIRAIPNKNIRPGMLYAYLSSKYGYALLTQGTFGAVIQHIEPDFVSKLPMPEFPLKFQDNIHDLITRSATHKENATLQLASAHKLIGDSIFEGNSKKNPRIDVCDFKTVISLFQSRLDSTFYLNFLPIESAFSQNIIFEKLGNLVKQPMFTAQRGRRVYVKKGIKFLSTSDISQSNPLRINKYLSLKTNGLKTLMVQKNWILVSSSGQEILGSTFLVDDTYHGCAVNQHSIRVIVDEEKISPYFVFAFLSHPRIKEYIRAGIYGSAILTINEDYLDMLKVPLLSADLTSEISKLIAAYQKNKEEACKLEYDAIALIEKEIESWQR